MGVGLHISPKLFVFGQEKSGLCKLQTHVCMGQTCPPALFSSLSMFIGGNLSFPASLTFPRNALEDWF